MIDAHNAESNNNTEGFKTMQRYLYVSSSDTSALRSHCKKNRTTLTAAIVVAGLAAVKVAFGNAESGRKFPKHQGWIVTSSQRHLLPQSRLLDGGDRETDPSVNVIGSYGGSITVPKFKAVETSRFWERCQAVKRQIEKDFFPSMRRLKLLNWVFRRPKVWKWVQKKTSNADLHRY